jgi:hypothetical protein
MQRLFLFLGVLTTATLTWSSPATAQASKRHLVYNFTVGIQSDERTDAQSAGTWDNRVQGNVSDKGEIVIDYLGVEADGGLIVNVAEKAQQSNRTLAATACVIYPNTNVQCGTGSVNPEEITIMRTLSPKFFSASAMDVKHHWNISAPAAGVNIDFTANPKDGGDMSIDSQRVEKTTNGDSTSATATYQYSPARFLPTQLKEYTLMHQQSRPGQYASIRVDITATLTSDSLATGS